MLSKQEIKGAILRPRTDRRTVLLMYISKVSGHRQATVAIQKSLRQLDPTAQTPSINGFGYAFPLSEKIINKAYMGVIKRTPKIWDYLYDNPKVFKRSQSIKNFFNKSSHKKLARLLGRFQPDTVVCTQAFPCGMVADYKRTYDLDIKLIGVLTDFEPHSYWVNEGVNYYVVPTPEAKERLITKGAPPESIKVYGIPIRYEFTQNLDKHIIAERLGLDLKRPIILIMGGGQGLGPIRDVVQSLSGVSIPLQLIVITGTNKKLTKWLGEFKEKTDKKIIVYEYANNVNELMKVANLIVTKPGGMTTSEALTMGLPMVIINPIPGQEMRNTDFLLKHGMAIHVHDTIQIGEEIEILLKSPERLAAMSQAAYGNSHPYAALDIARLILNYPERETMIH